ncbi:HNH endonuclease [Polynucleobacter paneuropaeus]|uniref:HNH endonuclease n=1 Tax=Polynucleobacter paneuropaeus TaxID=2527775 RepID=UPI001BFD5D16|nr:HNH endonuclease signature motif containing protein [Polynucleobacter paneuropaeus]MBT8631632.1 HNH endonuclease [Polynucleobacter paneuropaeus]
MPYANKRNCGFGGCAAAVDSKKRFCPAHTKVKNRQDYELYRKDDVGQKVYKSKAWANTRRYHLHDHPNCVECDKEGIYNVENPEVDHVIPLKEWIAQGGDPLDQTNLQTLCLKHHGEKTRRGE